MEFIDFLIEHASEVMKLCFGIGFLLVAVFVARMTVVMTATLRNINEATDNVKEATGLFVQYIQVPIAFALTVRRRLKGIVDYFTKE